MKFHWLTPLGPSGVPSKFVPAMFAFPEAPRQRNMSIMKSPRTRATEFFPRKVSGDYDLLWMSN